MTPDLFEEGTQRLAGQLPKTHNVESGGAMPVMAECISPAAWM